MYITAPYSGLHNEKKKADLKKKRDKIAGIALANHISHKSQLIHVGQGVCRAWVFIAMETMLHALSVQRGEFNLILHTASLSSVPDNRKGRWVSESARL